MRRYLLLTLLALVLTGCYGMSEQERWEAQFYATQYAKDPANIPPPKYQTMAATALNYTFNIPTATGTPNPHWTPTMNGYDFANTQSAQVQNNALTAQAQQQAYDMQKLKAEQAAESARETAQAHAEMMTAPAKATNAQATDFAKATAMQGTAYWEATATERAVVAANIATGTAFSVTQAYQPTSDILTLQAAHIVQTVEAGEAERVELAVNAQKSTNLVKAWLPIFVIVALAYVGGQGFQTFVKQRMHARDEHGRKQSMTRELPDGGVVYVDPEKLETGILKIGPDGNVVRYAPMDKQEQSDLNRRGQAVDAIAALPTPYANKAPQLLGAEFGRQTPRVNFRSDNAMSPVLDEADAQFLEGGDE